MKIINISRHEMLGAQVVVETTTDDFKDYYVNDNIPPRLKAMGIALKARLRIKEKLTRVDIGVGEIQFSFTRGKDETNDRQKEQETIPKN